MRNPTTPVKEVIESFLLHRQDLSERTVELYRYNLVQFVKWVEEGEGRVATLADLEPGTVNAYTAHRRTHGSRKLAGSPHQARNAAVALKSFANFLAERRIIHEGGFSVLRYVRIPKVKDEARRALRDEELATVLERAGEGPNGQRDRAIVTLIAGAGLRLSEAWQLRLCDLDFGQRLIRVRASTSKSVHDRDVTMHAEVARELDDYIRDYRADKDEVAPLFVTRSGMPFTRTGFRNIFRRLKERTGIRDFCTHHLRHTWATNYRRAGSGDLFDLQAEGGWSDLRMVRRYSKDRPLEERRRAPSPLAVLRTARNVPRVSAARYARVADSASPAQEAVFRLPVGTRREVANLRA